VAEENPERLPAEPEEAIAAILREVGWEKPGALRAPLSQLPLTFYLSERPYSLH